MLVAQNQEAVDQCHHKSTNQMAVLSTNGFNNLSCKFKRSYHACGIHIKKAKIGNTSSDCFISLVCI